MTVHPHQGAYAARPSQRPVVVCRKRCASTGYACDLNSCIWQPRGRQRRICRFLNWSLLSFSARTAATATASSSAVHSYSSHVCRENSLTGCQPCQLIKPLLMPHVRVPRATSGLRRLTQEPQSLIMRTETPKLAWYYVHRYSDDVPSHKPSMAFP